MSHNKIVSILGVPIAVIDPSNLVHEFEILLDKGVKGWITGINAHALNLAYENHWLRDFYHNALLNCAEGVGVTIAAFLSGVKAPKRQAWADITSELFRMLQQKKKSVYILGSTDAILSKAIKNLQQEYPQLSIVGYHHGYFMDTEEAQIIKQINTVAPDVLFVGMGMPKQEFWIYRNASYLNVGLIFPVGALIDYISGVKKRCPRWMAVSGLEWFYRLLCEPQRVWKRYLIGNPLLIVRSFLFRFRTTEKKNIHN